MIFFFQVLQEAYRMVTPKLNELEKKLADQSQQVQYIWAPYIATIYTQAIVSDNCQSVTIVNQWQLSAIVSNQAIVSDWYMYIYIYIIKI